VRTGVSDLPAIAVKRPLLAGVLNLLIILAGLAAIFGVEVRELPDVDEPIVSVNASFPGAAPETIDAEVTSILEGAVARVSGVEEVTSSSEEGRSRVRAAFRPGVDLDTAASDVREAVSQVTNRLPDRVEQVTVVKADDQAESIVSLAVLGPGYTEEALTERIETDIVPEFLAIEGIASVDMFGSRQREMRVMIDPLRLSRYALTVSDVANALRQAPFDVPVGSMELQDQQLIVRAEATAATPELVKNVVIADDTRVGDVAEVFFAPADAGNSIRLNGEPLIGIGVVRQAQSNTIAISDAVLRTAEQLNERFDDVELIVTTDEAEFIRHSVEEVLISLAFTIVIVIATLWLFFGSLRATLIPSTAIPTALVGAVAGIWLLGFSVNLLTLLALVLATGLIVDDAIVVLENIQRLQKNGVGRRAAAVLGTRQVFFAVVSTTAVLASVFIPISFLPSTAGRLFREFGFVLALAVVISGFVALTAVPALAARLSMNKGERTGPSSRGGRWLAARYGALLHGALQRPIATLVACLVLAGGAAALYPLLRQELVPEGDRGMVMINATGPVGVGIEYMSRQADQIEDVLQPYVDSGEVRLLFTQVGQWDSNRVRVVAMLAPFSERERSQQEIIESLEEPLSRIPGSSVSAFGRGALDIGGGGGRSGLEVALTGPEYPQIFAAAQALAEAIETESELLTEPEISYQPTQPQLSIQVDRQRAADLGVPLDELSAILRAMVGGEEVVDLNVGDQAIPIVLQAATGAVATPSDLRNLSVRSTDGELIPLSSMTSLTEEGVASELERVEQRRAIELEANIAPGVAMSEAIAEIRRLGDEVLPPEVDILLQGEAETLGETSRDMLITYVFAFVIVFLVLAAQFESLTSPIVVILSVPFGLAAAVFALFVTGTSLNIFSQIGLLMLIGLMAKNGILLVEFADQLRAEGRSVREAIEEAAVIRLRPIMMTLVSTVVGALPLIMASGAGAEARTAIGWTIFAGLGIASMFSIFLTPVIYLGVARFGRPRSASLLKLEHELVAAEGRPAAAEGLQAE